MCTTVLLTPVENGKSFNYFFGTPLSSGVNKKINFPSSSLQCVSSMILFPLFAAGFVDTGGNLLLVSTTSVVPVAKLAAGVVDTGCEFAAGVIDAGAVDTGGAP
jgi:hypothetical protein